MRKRLYFLFAVLVISLVLALMTNEGYQPFSNLSETDISSVGITLGDKGEVLLYDDSTITSVVQLLHEMSLTQSAAETDASVASLKLLRENDDEIVIDIYKDKLALDSTVYLSDSEFCESLYKLLLNLT